MGYWEPRRRDRAKGNGPCRCALGSPALFLCSWLPQIFLCVVFCITTRLKAVEVANHEPNSLKLGQNKLFIFSCSQILYHRNGKLTKTGWVTMVHLMLWFLNPCEMTKSANLPTTSDIWHLPWWEPYRSTLQMGNYLTQLVDKVHPHCVTSHPLI